MRIQADGASGILVRHRGASEEAAAAPEEEAAEQPAEEKAEEEPHHRPGRQTSQEQQGAKASGFGRFRLGRVEAQVQPLSGRGERAASGG